MKNFIQNVGEHPVRALEWPLWAVQFFGGLFIVSPWFHPGDAPSGNLAVAGDPKALKIYGVVLVVIGLAGIIGRARVLWPLSLKFRKFAAFACFFLFFYFTLIRIFVNGIENLGWTTFFLNSCMAAVIYLRLKFEDV